MIPLHKVHIPRNFAAMSTELLKVMSSGWVGEGPKVLEFEKALQPWVGSQNVTAVNACTSALTIALRLAGVGPGDEVITTPMTCQATNIPILHAGAIPVWADIQPLTGNICPDSIKSRLTAKTKAIMIVDWGGYPCDLDEINQIAKSAGVPVIQDAAHSFTGFYRGARIGSHCDFVCFSFQAIKHIHTGDGGAIVCKDIEHHKRARNLRWFGIDREHRRVNEYGYAHWDIEEAGYKFHMNDIAATIGLSQIGDLYHIKEKRGSNEIFYDDAFRSLDRVDVLDKDQDRHSGNWLYTLLVDDQVAFIKRMAERRIATSIVHERNDTASIFKPYRRDDLPGLDEFSRRMVCIPVGQWVDKPERKLIIEGVTAQDW